MEEIPEPDYPEIKPGGSLMLAWQVRDRRVLVVGGGDVRSLAKILTTYTDLTKHCIRSQPAAS